MRIGEWEEGWRKWDDFGTVFCRASIQCLNFPSFIVGGFLKPHLHSWPLVSPLPSFVHLSTSQQKLWVHAVLERHLVDPFKAFRLYNLRFLFFSGFILGFYASTHIHIWCTGIGFLACFSSFHSSNLLTEVNFKSVTKTNVMCNFCTDKGLWLTFHACYDELQAFILPRHSSLGLGLFIEMWTTDSCSL